MARGRAKRNPVGVRRAKDPESGRDVVEIEVGNVRVRLTAGQARSLGGTLRRMGLMIDSMERWRKKEEAMWKDLLHRLTEPTEDDLGVLGLSRGCTADDVRAAYRRLAKETHPDRGGSVEEFRRVNEAYERVVKVV